MAHCGEIGEVERGRDVVGGGLGVAFGLRSASCGWGRGSFGRTDRGTGGAFGSSRSRCNKGPSVDCFGCGRGGQIYYFLFGRFWNRKSGRSEVAAGVDRIERR